jgi:hypothetical protein
VSLEREPPPLLHVGSEAAGEQDLRGDRVEAPHEARELRRADAPSQVARPANVGEEERNLDLRAAHLLLVEAGRPFLFL